MRLVVISDTHLRHEFVVPDGDVLVHCGDATTNGSPKQLERFGAWISTLPHRHKIVIAGNHDVGLARAPTAAARHLRGVTYLCDSQAAIDGIAFYGSPWQPEYNKWAFNLPRGRELAAKWAMIPSGTDVLITHGPPFGILDVTSSGEHVGCEDLLSRVRTIRPRVHLFGHIHRSHGAEEIGETLYVNASICGDDYRVRYDPYVIDIDESTVALRAL
jgi:predicted phosphodiesterase